MMSWSLIRRKAFCPARAGTLAGLTMVALFSGCASRVPLETIPVQDMSHPVGSQGVTTTAPTVVAKPPPGIENLGKPGYYQVKPGDTLMRIGQVHGQNWRDIARWNNLENVNVIEVGQVLRVIPPNADVTGTGGVVQTIPNPVVATAPLTAPKPAVAAEPSTSAGTGDDDLGWIWPVTDATSITGFDGTRNKGINIAGKEGDPVLAAASGRVVYAGNSLPGYGNLIIIKHNKTFLSAYAHNKVLLVKEDEEVRKGQKIAEMGHTDSDKVQLHFEIRRDGKPIDPAGYLPKR